MPKTNQKTKAAPVPDPAQHHLNLAELLKAIGHVTQVLAAVTPLVIAPLSAGGVVDAQDAALATQEAAAASVILSETLKGQGQ